MTSDRLAKKDELDALDATDVGADPAGTAASFASAAATALSNHEADTTAIHGIADTSVLETTTGSAAKVAAEAALARNADNLTSGTVADARIASTIARDTEVTSAVSAEATARDAAISTAIANLIASAPGALDTLNELAAALGNDPNFAATVTTALAGKQPLDSDLTAIAALTTTSYGRALLALADAAAGRTALGLGTAATHATGDYDAAGAAAAAQAASQPLDSDLTAIAALTTTSYGRAFLALADAAAALSALGLDGDIATLALPASTTISAFGASLIDDAAASNARTTLGLGTAAVAATGDFDAAGAAAAAQAASQPLDSDLTAIAALSTTSYGRSLLAAADAAALRTLAGLVIGTNVQAFDADLSTYAGITPGALGQAILPMTTLTNHGIVLGAAGAAPTALAPDASTTKFLKNSVASDAPTWQLIAETDVTNLTTDLAAKALPLVPTAVKTATTYTAAAQDFVPCDTTSNAITVTLPNAPADKTLVGVKHVIQGGTNSVTIACAGSDVINKASGATSASLPNLAESYIFQYKASGAIWYIVEHDAPRTSQFLDSIAPGSALAALTALNAAKLAASIQRGTGYYILSGLLLAPNGTPTKLDMALGVSFVGTTELTSIAQSAIAATTISTLAAGLTSGQSLWAWVEMNSSGTINVNSGSASSTPTIPDITAARVPLGLLWIPYNATNVDIALTTSNGNAKLYTDIRQVIVPHEQRDIGTDASVPTLGNVTSLTSFTLATHNDHAPAKSLSTKDVLTGTIGVHMNNATGGTTSTGQVQLLFGGVTLIDLTSSASIASSGSGITTNVCKFLIDFTLTITGTTTLRCQYTIRRTTAGAANSGPFTAAEKFEDALNIAGFDTTAIQNFDVKAKNATSSTGASWALDVFTIAKRPGV